MYVNSSCGNNRNSGGCGCNNGNGGCGLSNFLNNLLYGSGRNGNGNGNGNSGCGCGSNRVANNNNCGCFDAYYARQYGLNMGCCGRTDWFSCQTRSTCCCANNSTTGYSGSSTYNGVVIG